MIRRFDDIPTLLATFVGDSRPALTFYEGRTFVATLSYGELATRVEAVAGHLAESLGVRRGDRIAILAPNRLEIPVLVLAIMRLGAALVPLNPTAPADDWAYILAHSKARGVFATADLAAKLSPQANVFVHLVDGTAPPFGGPAGRPVPAVDGTAPPFGGAAGRPVPAVDGTAPPFGGPAGRPVPAVDETAPPFGGAAGRPVPAVDEVAGYRGTPPPAVALDGDMAVILYTSGTTGRPKGVVLAQRSLLANGWSMAVNFGLDGTTQFAVLPLYHAHAFGFGLMTALTSGGHLVFADRFDPFAWSEIIRVREVAITSVVPTLLPLLLQVRVTAERVPTLRGILVSSAPLGVDLAREFEQRTKIPLVQGWGLSEYTNFACCMAPNEPQPERDELMFDFDVPSVGSALSGTEVRVVDLAGNEAPPGTRGELCVRGHSTMLTYLEDPEATAKTIDADGWLHTGDEGTCVVHRGKRRFFISGRIKEIIIRGGDKHSPIALERILIAAVPELLSHIAILGFPHQVHGEEIGAYIESEVVTDDVRARLTAALDTMTGDQRPKIVLFGAAPIPRTHTGKVQRRKLLPLFEPYANCRGATKLGTVSS